MPYKVSNDYGSHYFTTLEGANDYQFQTGGTIKEISKEELAEAAKNMPLGTVEHPSVLGALHKSAATAADETVKSADPSDPAPSVPRSFRMDFIQTSHSGKWFVEISQGKWSNLSRVYDRFERDWLPFLDTQKRHTIQNKEFPYQVILEDSHVTFRDKEHEVSIRKAEFATEFARALDEARKQGFRLSSESAKPSAEEINDRSPKIRGINVQFMKLVTETSNKIVWKLFISEGSKWSTPRIDMQHARDWLPLLDPQERHLIENERFPFRVEVGENEVYFYKDGRIAIAIPKDKFAAEFAVALSEARKRGFRFADETSSDEPAPVKPDDPAVPAPGDSKPFFIKFTKSRLGGWSIYISYDTWWNIACIDDQCARDWLPLLDTQKHHVFQNEDYPYRVQLGDHHVSFLEKEDKAYAVAIAIPKAEFAAELARALNKARKQGFRFADEAAPDEVASDETAPDEGASGNPAPCTNIVELPSKCVHCGACATPNIE